MSIEIEIDFDVRKLDQIIKKQENLINRAAIDATNDILTFTELAQIKRYTTDSMPPKPAGSTYQRTFKLRKSSRVTSAQIRGRDVLGKWEALASYAQDVLGARADQSPIHRGRWRSLEDVVQRINQKAPEIVDKHLKRLLR